ncbi:MAG: 50S ribosomal protein L23 [Deltaproteobacteria bacterium]|nr:50S ribosomal protein L23 [Deltaproteobacteria bacterium]
MRGPHQILVRPCMTEKTSMLADSSPVVVFEVVKDANKIEIANAVKAAFAVEVKSVRTSIVRGKSKRRGRIIGRRQNWKKAIVTLGEGQSIDFYGTASSV